MELRHLRYFLAVAEEGHFGRAAEKLHIVQPALSMQIRSLEEELGAPLFIRTSRKVELTEAGKILINEARRTIGQAERAKDLVARSARGDIGSVRIGFSGNAFFMGKLSDDLKLFARQSPQVEIVLIEMAPREQAEAILAGELDISYSPAFNIDFHPDLNVEQIGSWPWLIAMSSDHQLTGKPNLRKADLSDQMFILYSGQGADEGQLELLRQIVGKEPNVSHRVRSTLTVLTMASAGLGLGLVPAPLARVAVPGIEYPPFANQEWMADLVLISRGRETSGSVRKFLSLARRN